jgi:hypothetical protein
MPGSAPHLCRRSRGAARLVSVSSRRLAAATRKRRAAPRRRSQVRQRRQQPLEVRCAEGDGEGGELPSNAHLELGRLGVDGVEDNPTCMGRVRARGCFGPFRQHACMILSMEPACMQHTSSGMQRGDRHMRPPSTIQPHANHQRPPTAHLAARSAALPRWRRPATRGCLH